MDQQTENAAPIACNRSTMSSEQRARYQDLRRWLREAARRTEDLPAGYALGFDADGETLGMLAEFIGLERLCCPFFDFGIELRAGDDRAWLKLTGPDGAKAVLQSELGVEVETGSGQD
jgi:hypothetical protein